MFLRGAACFLVAVANVRDCELLRRGGTSLTRLPVRLFSRYEASSSLVRQLRTLSFGDELDRRIAAFDAEFVQWARENEDARRLTTIPGFGAIVASALVAAVGHAESFDHGRDLAAWLGLVPRQFTTGGKPKLLGISKRGNKYLRKQLIHGARAALPYVAERNTPLGRWAKALMMRTHHNVAVVAFANKLARIVWAVLRRGEPFNATGTLAAA